MLLLLLEEGSIRSGPRLFGRFFFLNEIVTQQGTSTVEADWTSPQELSKHPTGPRRTTQLGSPALGI